MTKTMQKVATQTSHKIIISGGGTGGHIFPAISIANALKAIDSTVDILFVGALGRMEMEKVPAAGYRIIGLPIMGFQRKLSLKNIVVVYKLMISLMKAKRVIKEFRPEIAVGVGGQVLRTASKMGIPNVLQEQNSYAGVTNKLLAQKAAKICVAYENMEKYFPAEKIVLTGNPVRQDLESLSAGKQEAYDYFGLVPGKKVLLVLGGSLGARTLNQSFIENIKELEKSDIQVIWQTGSRYIHEVIKVAGNDTSSNIKVHAFITRMDLAYAAVDLVISRAGAGTISELCLVAKPCILVPSPNVAEDHQTKNAMALVSKKAAIMVTDADAPKSLIKKALETIQNEQELKDLSVNISKLAMTNSAKRIAGEILQLIRK